MPAVIFLVLMAAVGFQLGLILTLIGWLVGLGATILMWQKASSAYYALAR